MVWYLVFRRSRNKRFGLARAITEVESYREFVVDNQAKKENATSTESTWSKIIILL